MNHPKEHDDKDNKQPIYVSINEFFVRAIRLKESGKIEKYLRFQKNNPDKAPFNNALAFIQNPDVSYYASAYQWEKRFNRTIKENARPMVILFPFGPVEFVFDIENTEGESITDEKILYWWRENGGEFDGRIMERTCRNLEQMGIKFQVATPWEYFEGRSLRTGGTAERTESTGELAIHLHPRYKEPDMEAYGVLCHEIAHILLGHLGQRTVEKKTKDGVMQKKIIVKDRQHLPRNIQELEAELVAWIVFAGLGIEKESEAYIAGWLTEVSDIEKIDFSEVFKVAAKIQEMGKGGVK